VFACVVGVCASPTSRAATSRDVLKIFADPPREFASGPLWVWNDRLTEEQIRSTMRDFAGQKVMQVFVHPRPGLMTPYLSDEWFRLWKTALDEARRLDMNVWIYDENSYPSGFAGGFVPDAMPESRGRGLALEEKSAPPAWSDDLAGVYRVDGGAYENVTADAKSGKSLAAGRYVVARVVRSGTSPWFGGKSYVDLLRPGVTEKFLEITLGAYQREVGDEFGKRIPGIFTDEPHLRPARGMPWSDGLPAAFRERWGYSLLDHLPSLTRPTGEWKRVRHDYYQLLLELFVERWGKPYYEACEKLGLEFTGHYWEHEWPRCVLVPDNMAAYAWHQRPAIDTLMNRYDEGPHAQFGNARAVRELSSVANQLNRKRTLCEAYGAAGWELRFEDMKRITDWLFVLGVNTMNEHLSYVTLRGARKRDHPQSFSYHAPWWNDYHARTTYTTRLAAALSSGLQVQQFLLVEPTTTAWFYQADSKHAKHLEKIGTTFQELVMRLEMAQVEYDLGSEDIIARHGSYRVRRLKVGKRAYRAVVLPPMMETISKKTAELLEELSMSGGTVIYCGAEPPALIDGRPQRTEDDADPSTPAPVPFGWKHVSPEDLPAYLDGLTSDGFAVRRAEGDQGILFHHRRKLADGEIVFLANTSDKAPARGTIASTARGAERWNLETGHAEPVAFRIAGGGVELPFDLPPCGSLLVFLSWEPREPAAVRETTMRAIPSSDSPTVRRLAPNVLTLDFVDVTAGGETRTNEYVYRAGQFAFTKNGMARNPWDSAVQFRDELITRKFPADSGAKVAYRFTIEGKIPESIAVVVERPDLWKVRLNGKLLPAWDKGKGDWWLDRSFGKLDVRATAKVGENVLELTATPFSIYHEIESAYVVGDFGVKPVGSGFAIVPASTSSLKLGPWKSQHLPLYGGGVGYTQTFDLPALAGSYRVRLPAWHGSVARVVVNGKNAGVIETPPYERDVTAHLKTGTNTIEVVVIGTLKNTLGPHHGNPGRGAAWPNMFHRAPRDGRPAGSAYDTIGYGLFAPFVLEETRPR